jgi:hypothetical protein
MTPAQLATLTDKFVTQWTNHRVTTDGNFPRGNPAQCWDLVDRFGKDVVGCPILSTRPGGNGGAVDCYRLFITPLPRYYTRHAINTITPRKGDVVVWSELIASSEGHIAIYLYPTPSGFVSFDQNWVEGSGPTKVTHNWSHVLGFLRPITQEGEAMIADTDNEYSRWSKLFFQVRGRGGTRDEFRSAAVGKTWLNAIEILSDSPEADAAEHAQEVGQVAVRDKWDQQIFGLEAQIGQLNNQVTELAKRPTADALKQLQDGLANCQVSMNDMSKAAAQVQSDKPVLVTAATPNWFTKLLLLFKKK